MSLEQFMQAVSSVERLTIVCTTAGDKPIDRTLCSKMYPKDVKVFFEHTSRSFDDYYIGAFGSTSDEQGRSYTIVLVREVVYNE